MRMGKLYEMPNLVPIGAILPAGDESYIRREGGLF
jgi:hypothetical protein